MLLDFEQQIIGGLSAGIKTYYYLNNSDSPNNEFFDTEYKISWNRRAYNLGVYYNSEAETGGIKFNIHSFNFDGIGDNF